VIGCWFPRAQVQSSQLISPSQNIYIVLCVESKPEAHVPVIQLHWGPKWQRTCLFDCSFCTCVLISLCVLPVDIDTFARSLLFKQLYSACNNPAPSDSFLVIPFGSWWLAGKQKENSSSNSSRGNVPLYKI